MTAAVFAAGFLLGVTGSAGAAPTPTVSQVQAKLKSLELRSAQLGQQYDQVKQELGQTNRRLALVDRQISADSGRFNSLKQQIALIGVSDYESGNFNSSMALLASGNPQQILDRSSILLELSDANAWQIKEFLQATSQLRNTQLLAQRTKAGIQQLKASLIKRKKAMDTLVSQEEGLLGRLTAAQQAAITPGSGGSSSPVKDPVPTSSQAGKAVAFAYNAIGCPYVYGGTGPCSAGYDCSGLTMQAWAAAGISIPRTSYEQWDSLPHVSTSSLEPGDILVFAGASHVGIYVGNNKLIDAPVPGQDVELVSLSGWYTSNLDGAVRP